MTCYPTPYKPKITPYGAKISPFSSRSQITSLKENPFSKIESPYIDKRFCAEYLLQENDFFLLQESGDRILL